MDAAYQEARRQKARRHNRAPTRHRIPKYVMAHICNPETVLYNAVCKFHVSDRGNECRYGSQCHFLHFKHLHREPTPTQSTPKLPILVSTLLSEVGRLGKLMELVTAKLNLSDGDKKTNEQYVCVETETEQTTAAPASHKSTSAAIKVESSSRSGRRTPSAFATSLSSALASKKAKKKTATKKAPKRKNSPKKSVTQKARSLSLEEQQSAALEDVKRRLSDLDSLYDEQQPRSMRETCALLGLGYRSPISDAEEPFIECEEID